VEVYQIAVKLAMTSNAPAFLSALSSQLIHVHAKVKELEGGLNRLSRIKLAVGGGLAIFGGEAAIKGLTKLVDKGNELVRIQQNMAQAGVKATEIQEAYAKAWQMTGKYQNVGAAEALKVINEGRMTFGSQHLSTAHAEDFIRMISFLKAYQGGRHGANAANFESEAIAAMKSGEIAGKIMPEEMAEHVKQLTAMRVAYGDQLKIGQYLTAQRAAGVALRNAGDDFRYGMFPALVQENGPGAGVMLMTAFNKIVAGTGNRTKSLEHMADIGLLNSSQLEYDKIGRVKGLKDPSAILNNRDAALNFGSWVMKTFKPLLDAKTRDPIREAQMISAMFPDRNAAKAITEVLQQFSKLSKDAQQMVAARQALNEGRYLDESWEGQKQAFEEQWNNLMQALGSPLVKSATEILKDMNKHLAGFSQWASLKENASSIEAVGKGLAIIGAALTAGGAAALIAALGPAGWLVAGIVALGAAAVAYRPRALGEIVKGYSDLWAALKNADFKGIVTGIKEVITGEFHLLPEKVQKVATDLATEIASWPTKLGAAITKMGSDLVAAMSEMFMSVIEKLKKFLNLGGSSGDKTTDEFNKLFTPGSYQGGGFGRLMQRASLGGANDNYANAPAAAGGSSVYAMIERAAKGDARVANTMKAIFEGESNHTRGVYDRNMFGENSQGPFQLNKHGGLGALFQRETGLDPADPSTVQAQADWVANYIARGRGPLSQWRGLPHGMERIRRGQTHPGDNQFNLPAAPPVAPPPPVKGNEITVHNHTYLDGRQVATSVTRHIAAAAKYPGHIGGVDGHGSWLPPGTTLTDAA